VLPEPKPGLVIRYDYLWTHEAATGREQGKDRPACLVAATDAIASPRFVVILPITHTPPLGDAIGVEIPAKVRQAVGLDDAPSWVIVSEHNVDLWPNGGLSPVPSRPGVFSLDCSRASRRNSSSLARKLAKGSQVTDDRRMD
jgi:hypothetical protein